MTDKKFEEVQQAVLAENDDIAAIAAVQAEATRRGQVARRARQAFKPKQKEAAIAIRRGQVAIGEESYHKAIAKTKVQAEQVRQARAIAERQREATVAAAQAEQERRAKAAVAAALAEQAKTKAAGQREATIAAARAEQERRAKAAVATALAQQGKKAKKVKKVMTVKTAKAVSWAEPEEPPAEPSVRDTLANMKPDDIWKFTRGPREVQILPFFEEGHRVRFKSPNIRDWVSLKSLSGDEATIGELVFKGEDLSMGHHQLSSVLTPEQAAKLATFLYSRRRPV